MDFPEELRGYFSLVNRTGKQEGVGGRKGRVRTERKERRKGKIAMQEEGRGRERKGGKKKEKRERKEKRPPVRATPP